MISLQTPRTAKYYQLSQHLQQQIVVGELSPNAQLPTEDVLTQVFGVSRGTVRKAVDLLEAQGLVRREQGRGTFVNDPSEKGMAGFVLSDFAKDMQRQQRQPSTKLLKQAIEPVSAEIATQLMLSPNDPVIHIQRLRLADNRPIIFEERFLSVTLCPELANENVETQSIHWLLVHKFKLPLVRVTHTVEMREVGENGQLNNNLNIAELLNLQPSDQVFAIERLTYTKRTSVDDADTVQPAVYYRALCHGEEYQFKAQFNTMI